MSEEKSPTFSQLAEDMSPERMDKLSEVATDVWGGNYCPYSVMGAREIPKRMLGDMGIGPRG